MSLIWPRPRAGALNGSGRFGRVIHWALTALAIPPAALCLYLVVFGTELKGAGISVFGILALALFFTGRGLRYILAGE